MLFPARFPPRAGAALAVALGVASFALGTDTAGSGRVPAALQGIVGIKPTLGVVSTIMSETGLSFLGFGIKQPDVSLGSMLADGANSVYSAPWLFAFPSLLLVMLTVSMALIGDGLRDALDPNSKAGGNA